MWETNFANQDGDTVALVQESFVRRNRKAAIMAGEIYYDDVDLGDEVGPVERVVTDDQVIEFTQVWGSETRPYPLHQPGEGAQRRAALRR